MGRKQVAKPSSDEGRRRILDAALTAFATFGYEGASLRSISQEAGLLHTAMLYHFRTKDILWRATMAELFDDLQVRMDAHIAGMEGAPPRAIARRLVREFVFFCAERPELHRIMTNEGRSDTPRLAWLVDTYTGRMFERVVSVAREGLTTIDDDPIRLYYAIVGLSASTFTLAPEYIRLSGRNPFGLDEIEATANLVDRLIFGVEEGK